MVENNVEDQDVAQTKSLALADQHETPKAILFFLHSS